ncbi:HMCN1 [Symbiodinium necroappetens]|uniref:HMCN1 protein n=1 Tax=Symbiodinium necroappetens TaxID=1628268 RepID=A0A812W7V8_9DINO|nr:HMCN1 [Symbiodinium necroappetens]
MTLSDEEEVRPLRLEEAQPDRPIGHRVKVSALAVALCLGAGALIWKNTVPCKPGSPGLLQAKFATDVDAQMALKVEGLRSVTNRSLADGIVMNAMKSAGKDPASLPFHADSRGTPLPLCISLHLC